MDTVYPWQDADLRDHQNQYCRDLLFSSDLAAALAPSPATSVYSQSPVYTETQSLDIPSSDTWYHGSYAQSGLELELRSSCGTSPASSIIPPRKLPPPDFQSTWQCPVMAEVLGDPRTYHFIDSTSQTSPQLSVSSTDSDYSPEHEGASQYCWQCNRKFDSFLSLDKHARQSLHKAWRCPEPDCSKTYARRDVFLRHRSTHRDGGHRCLVCRKNKLQKQFKRKDHLKEHIRSCHPEYKSDVCVKKQVPRLRRGTH